MADGKKRIRVLAESGCKACQGMVSYLEDDDVKKMLDENGVDDVKVISIDSEKGQRMLKNEVQSRLGKPIVIKPTTFVEDCNDNGCEISAMELGFGESFGKKLADDIGVDKTLLDRFHDAKDMVDGLVDMLRD